jgi:hypothetical protein
MSKESKGKGEGAQDSDPLPPAPENWMHFIHIHFSKATSSWWLIPRYAAACLIPVPAIVVLIVAAILAARVADVPVGTVIKVALIGAGGTGGTIGIVVLIVKALATRRKGQG